jgi:hypothetical protein
MNPKGGYGNCEQTAEGCTGNTVLPEVRVRLETSVYLRVFSSLVQSIGSMQRKGFSPKTVGTATMKIGTA